MFKHLQLRRSGLCQAETLHITIILATLKVQLGSSLSWRNIFIPDGVMFPL